MPASGSGKEAASPAAAEAEGEAQILVSEFPPPPFYYANVKAINNLTPPAIPKDALQLGTKRAAEAAARARAESERLRLAGDDAAADKTNSILGGATAIDEEDSGDVIGVFGEIVEDPLEFEPLDHCEDPKVIRDEVIRLNRKVVQDFAELVQELVHRPADNKKKRDELTHNIFLMLQETNKFREHQAREIMIELLESQLQERQQLLAEVNQVISKSDAILNDETPMDESK